MADDSDKIVEEIVLDLKTNWDSELRNTIRKMNQFKDQVADISKSAASSYGNFQKQFLSEFGNMTKNTVGEIRVLIGASRRELGELQKLNQDFIKMQDVALSNIERKSSLLLDSYSRKISQIQSKTTSQKEGLISKYSGTKSENLLPGIIAAIDTKATKQIETAKNDYSRLIGEIKSNAFEPLYLEATKVHSKVSSTIANTANSVLTSVTRTVADVSKQYTQLKNTLGLSSDSGKILRQSDFLKSTGAEYKNVVSAQKEQRARLDDLASLRKTAEESLMRVRKEDIEVAKKYLENIKNEQVRVMTAFEATGKQAMVLKDILYKASVDAKSLGQSTQKSLKEAISPIGGKLENVFQGSFKNFAEQINSIRRGDTETYQKLIQHGRSYQNQIGEIITSLKNWDSTLKVIRGKPGIDTAAVDTMRLKIAESLNSIKQYQTTFKEMQRDFSKLNISKIVEKPDTSAFRNIVNSIKEAKDKMASLGSVSENNFLLINSIINKLGTLHTSYAQKRVQLTKQIEEIERNAAISRVLAEEVANERIKSDYNKLALFLEKRAKGLRGLMESYTITVKDIKIDRSKLATQAQQVVDDIRKSMNPEDWLNKGIEKLKNDLIQLQKYQEKIGNTHLFKDLYTKQAEKLYSDLKMGAKAYITEMKNIEAQIVKLKAIQKSGLINSEAVGKDIAKLEEMKKQFSYAHSEFNRINSQASRSMQAINNTMSKSFLKSSMDMIRNFRWQYAAVYYILQNIIGRVAGFFTKTMDEIGQFQKDAMSLATVLSMRMFGNVKDNFQHAYDYSRGLMDRLQLVATETVLSLEDLTMLTKTFVQAGIVPETKEDVRKIAAIGTAVRAVTEGMANAGTQMRQELNAVILGRQRASDQLAMMFKFMGVNLKKVLEDAKKEGKDLLVVLSDALMPFDEMNKKLEGSWLHAKNRITEVWKIIKRVGAEEFTNIFSKKLMDFTDKLINVKGELTNFGKEIAAGFGATISTIGIVAESLFNTLSNIGNIIGGFSDLFGGSNLQLENMSTSLKGILNLSYAIMRVFVAIENITAFVAASLDVMSAWVDKYDTNAANAVDIMHGFTDDISATNKEADKLDKKLAKAMQNFRDGSKSAEERLKSIQDIINGITEKLSEAGRKQVDLGPMFKLPHDSIALLEYALSTKKQLQQAKTASLEGYAKFAEEHRLQTEEAQLKKKQLQEQLAAYEKYFASVKAGETAYDESQYARYEHQYNTFKDALDHTNSLIFAYNAERDKKSNDYSLREENRISRLKKEWNDFLINTYDAPTNEWQKLQKWILLTEETIKRLQIENSKRRGGFYDNSDAEIAYTEGIYNRVIKIQKEYTDAQKDLKEKIMGAAFKSPFAEIELDAQKLYNDIDKMLSQFEELDDHTNKVAEKWNLMVAAMRKTRMELTTLNLMQKNYSDQADLVIRTMKYWEGAYSPLIQRQARLNSATAQFNKDTVDIILKIKEIETQLENIKDDSRPFFEQMKKNYVDQLEIMRLETERLVWRELHPLWAEMIDMSKSWADSMTDAMADFVDQTKTAKEALTDLMNTVQRDVLRATIKKTITEPLMDFLGSGEPGSPTFLQKAFGKGGTPAATSMNKAMEALQQQNQVLMKQVLEGTRPIGVFIVGKPEGVQQAVKEATQGAVDQAQKTTDAVNATKEAVNAGTSSFLSKLGEIATLLASGQYAQAAGKSGGMLGSIFDMIGGLFSGGESGMASGGSGMASGGSGMASGGSGMAAASGSERYIAMAEGGTISEPIIGRGLKSGQAYTFGEKTPYGQNEIVSPVDKLSKMIKTSDSGNKFTVHMPINLSAIDTQSGVDFLMKNTAVLEGNIVRMIRSNRRIRDAMRNY